MHVLLNGHRTELAAGATVEDAVEWATMGAPARTAAPAGGDGGPALPSGLAVAVDGEVIPRSEWAATALADGQRIEVLHAVQGGA